MTLLVALGANVMSSVVLTEVLPQYYTHICSPELQLLVGRAGASPFSRATGGIFLYIYICIYIRVSFGHTTVYAVYFYFTVALQANVKPAHRKSNVANSSTMRLTVLCSLRFSGTHDATFQPTIIAIPPFNVFNVC